MRRLDGRVALVTGGASGLGKGIAERLASEGAKVVITDIQPGAGEAVAAACNFTFIQQDVCSELRWTQVIAEIEERFGRLNILVNNAGILGPMSSVTPENTGLEDWRRIFAVNVEGVFLGCRTGMAAMRRAGSGAIVNISSMATRMATPHATAYGASKAAVRHLTKSVAQHCAREKLNVRCNSVHPGMIRTPLLDQAMEQIAKGRGVPLETIVSEHKAAIPLGDFTMEADVAAAVAFLVSDDARHVTGAELFVDAGIVSCNS
jgi:NAD(P)-dependent dehydrogenase (short-subunit alcohol dehydrogenase family)